MARYVWLRVGTTVWLMGSVVIGQGELAQDPNLGQLQIEIVVSPPTAGDDAEAVAEFQRRLRQYDAMR